MKSSTFNGYPVHLIETVDELFSLKRIFSPKIMAGLDTETSSLEYKADQIAGVCVSGGVDYSPQGYAGYYIPLRHIGYGANLPVEVVSYFVQWLIDNFQTVFFNRNFDTSMLEYDGVKIPFVGGMQDAQIMAYSVFNEAYPALKDYSRRFLKWDMIDFADNKAKDHNFKTTDPTVSYIYAAGDPIATVFLARKLWNTYPYIRKIYKIDNYCLEAVRRLCQNELTLDYDFLEELRGVTERRLAELRTKIYSMSGVYGFNIDSSREKADVLSRFVTLTEKTKKGQYKTDEEALRRLNHPIANLMIDYAQTRVFLKSFVAKMCSYKGRIVRANYNTVNVPSGRLSSGASEGNPYFIPQNLQNVPKEEEKLYLHHHPSIGYVLDKEEEGCVRNAKGEPVKYKTKTGLHRAFIPHEKDWVIMSSDYAAQELRLAANFSRDPNFLEPLLNGNDIHMHVAKQMFGYEDPLHRTKVKIVNFSALYGAEYPTVSARLGIPKEEGKTLMNKYKQTMSKLYAWKAEIVKAAKKRGYALTYFGRPVYLLKYFNSPDKGMSAYAERLAVNATIQGCILADTYIPSQDGKTISTMRNFAGQRVQFSKDERGVEHKGVPVFRSKSPCAFVEFKSGDFVVVSTNHKFLKYKSNEFVSIEEAMDLPVQFVRPQKKVKLFQAILNLLAGRYKGTTLASLSVFPRHDKPANSPAIATALLRAFLKDEHLITFNPVLANSIRSFVDLYGYNLIKICEGRYALSWSRARKSKVCSVDNLKGLHDVMSPNMISGFQSYPLSGIIHKNTGADLMRLFLIKFTKLNIDNKDWRENTRMILPVHDEMNLEVSIPYMREAWLKMRKVMNFFPENFAVPIVVDTGVGTSWGNCLDVECISPKGRVVPKDIDPDDFSGEERAYLQEILEECVFEELPDRLKKFVKC